MLKLIEADKLGPWVTAIMKEKSVIGIQARADKFDYAALNRASDLRLDFDVSVNSPKRFFLLPEEELIAYSGPGARSRLAEDHFVLFGVHPYDVAAIRQLDRIFEMNNPDVHYLTRRRRALIVAVDVEKPSAHVFSGFLGFSHVESGFDLLLTKMDGAYLAEAATEEGRKLLALARGAPDATEKHLAARKKIWEKNQADLRRHTLKPPVSSIAGLLDKAYDHKIWKEKARLCFSCGTCNLVCPTCYCFDVSDHLNWDLKSGSRTRLWDGCMLEDFAVVAGPHNFRKDKESRFRHRYYRKGKYVPEKIGEFSCVGCGRCIGACVTHIANPVEVYNAIMEDN